MESVGFVVLASVLLFASLRVVTAKSPLRAALALIVAQVALAGLYVQLGAPFVASMQILLYAGAVMVLFVFVIMLLNLGDESKGERRPNSLLRPSAVLGMATVAGFVVKWCLAAPLAQSHVNGSVHKVGALLLQRFAFGFEAISVILLTAVVGAVALSLKRLT